MACGAALVPVQSAAAPDLATDSERCRRNLQVVFSAIQDYRRANKMLPERLGDLVPQYLRADDEILCPALSRRVQDPGRTTAGAGSPGAYHYEFEPKPLTNDMARNVSATLRTWRQLQMGRLGSVVPMVRCTNHSPVLNLSFGGEVYESDSAWEDRFSRLVQTSELTLDHLLAAHLRLEVVRIPARDPATPRTLIDLTRYYNGSIKGWLEWKPAINLANLPGGQSRLGGVEFDARGVIQLGSRQFNMLHRPAAVSNIVIGTRCHSLIFLHGALGREADSTTIGSYVLHFEDRSTEDILIAYGRQVLDLLVDSPNTGKLKNTQPAWTTPFRDESGQTKAMRLYSTRWINRRPDLQIESIDFVSSIRMSSPFLVAVSTEAADMPAQAPGANAEEPK